MAMAYSLFFTSVFSQIVNAAPNRKLLGYSYLSQLRDMLPQIGISLAMGAAVFSVQFLGLGDTATLAIQIPLGIVIYWALSKLFRVESYTYVIDTVKGYLNR